MSGPNPHRLAAGFCAALVFGGLAPARAQVGPTLEAGAPETATKRYLMGRELYIVGRLDDAAAEFRSAFELFPRSAKLAFNLARTYERLGKLPEAIDLYGKYLALAPKAPDAVEVRKIVQTLESRLAERKAELVLSTSPAGADILLDEGTNPLGPKTPTRLRVAPGGHVLRFRLTGYQEASLAVDAAERTSQAHHLELRPQEKVRRKPAAKPTLAASESAPAETGADRPIPWRPIVGYGLVGLGAVGLGVGGYFLVAAGADADDAAKLGPSPTDLEARDALQGDYDDHRMLGFVGLGAGAALAAGGAVVLLWPELTGGAAPAVALTPGGLSVHGAF